MFLFKIIKRLFQFALLLVIIIPLYVAGNIWWSAHHMSSHTSDVIVVMGAAEYNGVASGVLQERVYETGKVFGSGLAPVVITVGGRQKGDVYTEASTSYKALTKLGIPKKKIVVLETGKDTLSSTVAYVSYMKLHKMKSVIIVTDPYHCYRAVSEAKDLGVDATCAGVENGPGSLKFTGIKYVVRETGAYLAYKSVGHLGIHLSDQIKN